MKMHMLNQDKEVYRVAVQSYFFTSSEHFFGLSLEEIEENGKPEELASSAQNVIYEYFDSHDFIKLNGVQRLLIHDPDLNHADQRPL